MRHLIVLLSILVPALAWSEGRDIRRVDYYPGALQDKAGDGFSLEQVREQTIDSVSGRPAVRLMDNLSTFQNLESKYKALASTYSALQPVQSSAITYDPVTMQVYSQLSYNLRESPDLAALGAQALVGLQNFRDLQAQQDRRAAIVSQMARNLEERQRQSEDYNYGAAEQNRNISEDLRRHTEAYSRAASEALASFASALHSTSGISADSIASAAKAKSLAVDPTSYRSYMNNAKAVTSIHEEIRSALERHDYETAARLHESLIHDVLPQPIPDDIKKAFTKNGILVPERIDRQLPSSPLAQFQPQSYGPQALQLVQRTANRFQSVWATTNGLSGYSTESAYQYFAGLEALRSADDVLENDPIAGQTLIVWANALLDGAAGFGVGAVQSVISTAQGSVDLLLLYFMARHDPVQLFEYTKTFVMALPRVKDALIAEFAKSWKTLRDGSAYERGVTLGKITTDLLLNGKSPSLISQSERKAAHILRMAEKETAELVNIMESMPASYRKALGEVGQTAAEESVGFYRQLLDSPEAAIRTQASKTAEEALIHRRRYGLEGEKVNLSQKIYGIYDAKDVNQYFAKEFNYRPPFNPEIKVIEFASQNPSRYLRIHGAENQIGRWLVREDLLRKMTFEQIRDLYGVEMRALKLSEVMVPKGKRLWRGTAARMGEFQGGGVQYYVNGPLDDLIFRELDVDTFFTKRGP